MDVEKEIKKLEDEVRAIKVAMAQAGTNLKIMTITDLPWPFSDRLTFKTVDGAPPIAFATGWRRRIPSSSNGIWIVRNWDRKVKSLRKLSVWEA